MKASEFKKAMGKDGPLSYSMMDFIEETLNDVAANICHNFCKYHGTGNDDGCQYMLKEGECPFDILI